MLAGLHRQVGRRLVHLPGSLGVDEDLGASRRGLDVELGLHDDVQAVDEVFDLLAVLDPLELLEVLLQQRPRLFMLEQLEL